MAITYPIALPADPAPRDVRLSPLTFSSMTRSPWSGAQQVQLNAGMMWRFGVDFPPMSAVQAREWVGTLSQLNGRFGTFLFGDPLWKTPRGTWGGSPVVDGAGQAGQNLAVRGLSAGATGLKGDYFQLGSGSAARLHMVTVDFTADGAGSATLDIWPRLRGAPADGVALVTATPQGVFRLTSPGFERAFTPFRYGISFDIEEAL